MSANTISFDALTLAERPLYSDYQVQVLAQLHRLMERLRDYSAGQFADPLHLRLLRRGVYALYCECCDAGVESEAKEVLKADMDGPSQQTAASFQA